MSQSQPVVRVFDDDILVVGAGGTGKSFLAANYLLPLFTKQGARVLYWDPRRTVKSGAYPIVHSVAEMGIGGTEIVQAHNYDLDEFDAFCKKIEPLYNTVVFIDEIELYLNKYRIRSAAHHHILKKRPDGVVNVSMGRRSQNINNEVVADADHYIVFQSTWEGDKHEFRKWLGDRIDELDSKPEHSFIWADMHTGSRGFYKLMQDGFGKWRLKTV